MVGIYKKKPNKKPGKYDFVVQTMYVIIATIEFSPIHEYFFLIMAGMKEQRMYQEGTTVFQFSNHTKIKNQSEAFLTQDQL